MKFEDNGHCEFCGAGLDHARPWLSTKSVPWYGQEEFKLTECGKCRLIVSSKLPDRYTIYRNYLDEGEQAEAAVVRKRERPNVLKVHENHVARLSDLYKEIHGCRPFSIFDVGFGAGTVFEAAKNLGFGAFGGNEVNSYSVKYNRERLGDEAKLIHGFTKDIETIASYDVLMNFDYLEHSYEPFYDLKVCNSLLREGGLIYLKTLYMDNPDHLLKGDCYQLFGQGHFHYFRVRTLLAMVANAGFKILRIQLGPLVFLFGEKVADPSERSELDLSFLSENYNYLGEPHRSGPH